MARCDLFFQPRNLGGAGLIYAGASGLACFFCLPLDTHDLGLTGFFCLPLDTRIFGILSFRRFPLTNLECFLRLAFYTRDLGLLCFRRFRLAAMPQDCLGNAARAAVMEQKNMPVHRLNCAQTPARRGAPFAPVRVEIGAAVG